jgi:hypothetical protein
MPTRREITRGLFGEKKSDQPCITSEKANKAGHKPVAHILVNIILRQCTEHVNHNAAYISQIIRLIWEMCRSVSHLDAHERMGYDSTIDGFIWEVIGIDAEARP